MSTDQPYGQPHSERPADSGEEDKPKRRRLNRRILTIGGVLLAFVLGIAVGGGGDDTSDPVAGADSEPAPTVTVTAPAAAAAGEPADPVTETVEATVTVTAEAAAAPAPEPVTGGFSDGQQIVGTDVPPGRYRTVLPAEEVGGLCYADVTDGDSIVVQEVTDTGQTILDVPDIAGAILTSSDCGDWEPVT